MEAEMNSEMAYNVSKMLSHNEKQVYLNLGPFLSTK